jgi:(Z)-2-((N-methylformamido)methylene)-5-hydroxybutyrolactone dehydrogenase
VAGMSSALRDYRMLIGGEWVDAAAGETFDTVNPFTGRAWATVPRARAEDVDRAVQAARAAFGDWRARAPVERARLLRRLADLIAENASRIAVVETTDNGKLIREMEGQLLGLADYYHYFAGAADKQHGETIPAGTTNFLIYTLREPVGVVAAITPWNSPVLLASWKLAPALAAGCTVVVKPAEQRRPRRWSSRSCSARPASRPAW